MNDFKMSKEDIGKNFSQHYGCKFVQYSNNIFVPPELVKGINLSYLKKALWDHTCGRANRLRKNDHPSFCIGANKYH